MFSESPWQTLIVLFCVCLAAYFLYRRIRSFFRAFKSGRGNSCIGCSGNATRSAMKTKPLVQLGSPVGRDGGDGQPRKSSQ